VSRDNRRDDETTAAQIQWELSCPIEGESPSGVVGRVSSERWDGAWSNPSHLSEETLRVRAEPGSCSPGPVKKASEGDGLAVSGVTDG
jgi:hypothetical protein